MPATKTYADLQRYIRRTAADDGATTFDDEKTRSAIADGFRLLDGVRDWSFLRRTMRLHTVKPYKSTDDSSTITYAEGNAAIAGTSTTFQNPPGTSLDGATVLEGDRIEVAGEQTDYEIASVASEIALTLRDAYYGDSTGTDFIISRPCYSLPADFKSLRDLVGLGDVQDPKYIPSEEFITLNQNYAGVSLPYCWTHMQKYDDDAEYLCFFPAPDARYQYELRYNRRIGFLDISSSNAWFDPIATEPAAGDIVLWDDREISVLRAAIVLAAYEEYENSSMASMARDRFEMQLAKAIGRDSKDKKPDVLGRASNRRPAWY